MIRIEVAVAAPLPNSLTYLFEEIGEKETGQNWWEAYIGKRVLVPLGRRTVTGYILDRASDEKVNYTLRHVTEVLDEYPLFHKNIVPFFRWISRYYHFPIGDVISTALPAGLQSSSQKVLRYIPENAIDKPVWSYGDIDEPDWFSTLCEKKRLSGRVAKKILADGRQRKALKKLVEDQLVIIENELSQVTAGEKTEVCYITALKLHPSKTIADINSSSLSDFKENIEKQTSMSLKFSEVKALYYHAMLSKDNSIPVPQKEIFQNYKSAGKPLKELCQRGLITKTTRRIYRNPFGQMLPLAEPPKRLTSEQTAVAEEIEKSIMKGEYRAFLLHGVTGSGKTEVYLRAAEVCIKKGKDVLVIVPEIALATQLESHFVSRFGELVVLLHSGLSKGEKYDQWSLAATGKAKVVIGARSAVFAPLKNIGLIVVDEEHDSGFKQDDSLKYNGRDLAILRASIHNAIVILGSATPSVTSYFHAKSGKYTLLSMKNRVGSSVLPKVEIVDLKNTVKSQKKSVFHEKFENELLSNLERQEQSLILLNRRGFSTSYLCQDCGAAVQCQHCNVSLTFHKEKKLLACHYCGYTVTSNIICSFCHSEKLIPFGFGTERIEEELRERFPQARIARLDSDAAADRKKFFEILKAMHDLEIDILIGTQMIAKGHHFPNVTFVGVVWADAGLNMPDFRAAERTYQLLSQVTGRAGRGEKKGRVIIQTMRPKHYAIELSQNHQFEQFYEREIEMRKRPVFPPFVRLVCFKVSGDIEFNTRKTAQNITDACRFFGKAKGHIFEIFGPASSPLEKLKNQYRWQILIKSNDLRCLHDVGHYILENLKVFILGKTEVSIDIDPENMM